mmetsp:Transcript_71990/g.112749  ORF Transcript_71990/g.112749 Transcript_71990/m.112749 type:complete len:123 (-) Transcript_71990:69-437(-)
MFLRSTLPWVALSFVSFFSASASPFLKPADASQVASSKVEIVRLINRNVATRVLTVANKNAKDEKNQAADGILKNDARWDCQCDMWDNANAQDTQIVHGIRQQVHHMGYSLADGAPCLCYVR